MSRFKYSLFVIAFFLISASSFSITHGKKSALSPVFHGPRKFPRVALTFDACETKDKKYGYDAKIIKILKKTKTPATLFLGGKWMKSHEEETRALAKEPLFELGNHSTTHLHLKQSPMREILYEIGETQAILKRLTGKKAKYFRCPFGEYDARVLKTAKKLGMKVIQWDVSSGDPDKNITVKRMVPWVVSQVKNGSIIVMHVNGRGWRTAEALPEIIERLRAKGFRFVTVSDLLH